MDVSVAIEVHFPEIVRRLKSCVGDGLEWEKGTAKPVAAMHAMFVYSSENRDYEMEL